MSLLIGNRKAEQRAAHRLFAFSISYLFPLFAALLVGHTSDPHSSQLHPRPVGLAPSPTVSKLCTCLPASEKASSDMRCGLLFGASICAATLSGCNEGVLDPKGPIAVAERQIIINSLGRMVAIVIPTILATFGVAYWFRSSNKRARYQPEFRYSGRLEVLVWSIPAMTVLLVGGVAWVGAYDLDPRKAINAAAKPVNVQVVSLDWKWLFIYPGQGIASVNHLVVPAGTPISFELTSSGSFFVPQLGSQIYTMAGMATHLQLQADNPGRYRRLSAQFSGEGFADMHFTVDLGEIGPEHHNVVSLAACKSSLSPVTAASPC
jgi:cytochrome o ubiquinol oxidase subunit II